MALIAYSQQRPSRPSLVVAIAIFTTLILVHAIYSVASYRSSPSAQTQGDAILTTYRSSLLKPTPTQSPPSAPPRPPRSQCAATKGSMLYGAHKFLQLEAAVDSHRRHSERWGCGFELLEHDLSVRKLYSKHYFLLATLLHELSKPAEEMTGWLMWVGADSIIVNPALSPCTFLPPDGLDHVFALVTADHQDLNNGIFYIRVHPSSVDLLTRIVDYPLAHPDEDLSWFGEQAAMERVLHAIEKHMRDEGSDPGIAWVPRKWFNTFEFEHGFEEEPGHFIVHFAGLAETRLSHMANWLDELEHNQAKWEIPLEDTFYADAVPKFWSEFAANATKVTEITQF